MEKKHGQYPEKHSTSFQTSTKLIILWIQVTNRGALALDMKKQVHMQACTVNIIDLYFLLNTASANPTVLANMKF